MWIKGSGGDKGTLTRSGIAGLYTCRLRDLKKVCKGLNDEDRMVCLFKHCIYDLDSKATSIDMALHGLLPFKHIDHLHPDPYDSCCVSKGLYGKCICSIKIELVRFSLKNFHCVSLYNMEVFF